MNINRLTRKLYARPDMGFTGPEYGGGGPSSTWTASIIGYQAEGYHGYRYKRSDEDSWQFKQADEDTIIDNIPSNVTVSIAVEREDLWTNYTAPSFPVLSTSKKSINIIDYPGTVSKYSISYTTDSNSSVSLNKTEGSAGETIEATITPATYYESVVSVKSASGKNISYRKHPSGNWYHFEIPGSSSEWGEDVIITVTSRVAKWTATIEAAQPRGYNAISYSLDKGSSWTLLSHLEEGPFNISSNAEIIYIKQSDIQPGYGAADVDSLSPWTKTSINLEEYPAIELSYSISASNKYNDADITNISVRTTISAYGARQWIKAEIQNTNLYDLKIDLHNANNSSEKVAYDITNDGTIRYFNFNVPAFNVKGEVWKELITHTFKYTINKGIQSISAKIIQSHDPSRIDKIIYSGNAVYYDEKLAVTVTAKPGYILDSSSSYTITVKGAVSISPTAQLKTVTQNIYSKNNLDDYNIKSKKINYVIIVDSNDYDSDRHNVIVRPISDTQTKDTSTNRWYRQFSLAVGDHFHVEATDVISDENIEPDITLTYDLGLLTAEVIPNGTTPTIYLQQKLDNNNWNNIWSKSITATNSKWSKTFTAKSNPSISIGETYRIECTGTSYRATSTIGEDAMEINQAHYTINTKINHAPTWDQSAKYYWELVPEDSHDYIKDEPLDLEIFPRHSNSGEPFSKYSGEYIIATDAIDNLWDERVTKNASGTYNKLTNKFYADIDISISSDKLYVEIDGVKKLIDNNNPGHWRNVSVTNFTVDGGGVKNASITATLNDISKKTISITNIQIRQSPTNVFLCESGKHDNELSAITLNIKSAESLISILPESLIYTVNSNKIQFPEVINKFVKWDKGGKYSTMSTPKNPLLLNPIFYDDGNPIYLTNNVNITDQFLYNFKKYRIDKYGNDVISTTATNGEYLPPSDIINAEEYCSYIALPLICYNNASLYSLSEAGIPDVIPEGLQSIYINNWESKIRVLEGTRSDWKYRRAEGTNYYESTLENKSWTDQEVIDLLYNEGSILSYNETENAVKYRYKYYDGKSDSWKLSFPVKICDGSVVTLLGIGCGGYGSKGKNQLSTSDLYYTPGAGGGSGASIYLSIDLAISKEIKLTADAFHSVYPRNSFAASLDISNYTTSIRDADNNILIELVAAGHATSSNNSDLIEGGAAGDIRKYNIENKGITILKEIPGNKGQYNATRTGALYNYSIDPTNLTDDVNFTFTGKKLSEINSKTSNTWNFYWNAFPIFDIATTSTAGVSYKYCGCGAPSICSVLAVWTGHGTEFNSTYYVGYGYGGNGSSKTDTSGYHSAYSTVNKTDGGAGCWIIMPSISKTI